MKPRYAIYLSPQPDSALGQFGIDWFSDAEYHSFTKLPAFYGFHATLKAPFHLSKGTSLAQLRQSISELASASRPFQLPKLKLAELQQTLVLSPVSGSNSLMQLEKRCVQQLDKYRAPLTLADFEKRPESELTDRQRELRLRWGYPFVLDEFQFHITLTEAIPDPERRNRLKTELATRYKQHSAEYYCHKISLFGQDNRHTSFKWIEDFSFSDSSKTNY